MTDPSSRRNFLASTAIALGGIAKAGALTDDLAVAAVPVAGEPFTYCLNTSTINGSNLSVLKQIDIAAEAGFRGLEPWLRDIEKFEAAGGSLDDIAKKLRDSNLRVEGVIGFPEWIVDDDARRAKGLEQAKRDMDRTARIGGKHIAAPPIGAHNGPVVDLRQAAERYRALCDLGDTMGIGAQVEVWGGASSLNKLSDAAYIAVESGHPKASILTDVYHLYKGGSDPRSLRLLNGAAMHIMHVNDYPSNPPRAEITDAHRIYPGEGIAPLGDIFRTLRDTGFRGMLSVELFNRDYWRLSPARVARTAFAKLRDSVETALASKP